MTILQIVADSWLLSVAVCLYSLACHDHPELKGKNMVEIIITALLASIGLAIPFFLIILALVFLTGDLSAY